MTIPMSKSDELALGIGRALAGAFVSPNVSDRNGEAANVVDALDSIGEAITFAAKHLGNGNASAGGFGAIEGHAGIVREGCEYIAHALDGVAGALDGVAAALEGKSKGTP